MAWTATAFGILLQAYIDQFGAQPGTYAAGGPEREERRRRAEEGIPVPSGLLAELTAAGSAANVPLGL